MDSITVNRSPTHPGALLRDELEAMNMPVKTAAERLGVSRQFLHLILAEKNPVSPEMALRFGKLIGNGPDLWLAMQRVHDLWHAERAIGAELAKIKTHKAA